MRTLIALGTCTLMACGGSKWYSMKQTASPNPFKTPGCKLAVEPVAFEQIDIRGKTRSRTACEHARPINKREIKNDKRGHFHSR